MLRLWPKFKANGAVDAMVFDSSNIMAYMIEKQAYSIQHDVPCAAPPAEYVFVEGCRDNYASIGAVVQSFEMSERPIFNLLYPGLREPVESLREQSPEEFLKARWLSVYYAYSEGISDDLRKWVGIVVIAVMPDGSVMRDARGTACRVIGTSSKAHAELVRLHKKAAMSRDVLAYLDEVGDDGVHEAVVSMAAGLAMMTFSFLSCRNVQMVEHKASRVLQKINKPDKRPYDYHTLRIDAIRKVLDDAETFHGVGHAKALHICRGHFKTFEGKGLFGKHKGRYFWHSQVRGSDANRVVEKTYETGEVK